MLPKGPPLGRPGLGSHVSNWLGAPHNQSRMQCFCAFFVCAANTGLWNSPVKLDTLASTPPVNPLRKSRRCNRCSSGRHWPGDVVCGSRGTAEISPEDCIIVENLWRVDLGGVLSYACHMAKETCRPLR